MRIFRWLVIAAAIFVAAAQVNADVTLRGRVIDADDGSPLSNVRVKAYCPAMGYDLWSATGELMQSLTDAQGRFAIDVPAREVLFMVMADSLVGNVSRNVISGETEEIELKLKRGLRDGQVQGRVLDSTGKPAGELEIQLVGEYGFSATTKTGTDGSFQFTGLPSYFGQGVLVASRDEMVLPQRIVRSADKTPVEMRLVPAGRLRGTVIDSRSQFPVAGLTVVVRPRFASGFRHTAITDVNGEWSVQGLPPGEYLVEGDGPDHFDPSTGFARGIVNRTVRVGGGDQAPLIAAVSGKATLTGIVARADGQPIAGALVAVPVTSSRIGPTDMQWVRTAAHGGFTIKTGRLNTRFQLTAFDQMWGRQVAMIEPLAEGETRRIVGIELPGSVRVKGIVSDEAGRPIEGIQVHPPSWVSSSGFMQSADGGRFDWGRLTLADAGQPFTFRFQSSRPGGTGMSKRDTDTIWRTLPQVVEGKTFHIDAESTIQPQHDRPAEVNIALKTAQLLVLHGKIAEANGQAPINGQVFLFSGTATEEWSKRALPDLRGGGGFAIMANESRHLSGAECDAQGNYAIYVLRNDGEPFDAGTRFSLGIASNGMARKLLTELVIPRDKTELVRDVSLSP